MYLNLPEFTWISVNLEVRGVRGVGQGQAAGQAPGCLPPDMLVVAAEGMVDMEQEDKVLELLQMGLLAGTLEQLRGQ